MTTYKTGCGGTINISAKAVNHLLAHPEVFDRLESAIGKISLPPIPKKHEWEIDFGQIIGRAGVMNTSTLKLTDEALFAIRENRTMPSRVAPIGYVGEETQKMVVIARPSTMLKQYELVTSWIGTLSKKEPWDPSIRSAEEFNDCMTYWRSTALIHDPNVMGPAFKSSWAEILRGNQYLQL